MNPLHFIDIFFLRRWAGHHPLGLSGLRIFPLARRAGNKQIESTDNRVSLQLRGKCHELAWNASEKVEGWGGLAHLGKYASSLEVWLLITWWISSRTFSAAASARFPSSHPPSSPQTTSSLRETELGWWISRVSAMPENILHLQGMQEKQANRQ